MFWDPIHTVYWLYDCWLYDCCPNLPDVNPTSWNDGLLIHDPSRAESEVFRDNWVNNIVADALALSRPSATMVLTIQNESVCGLPAWNFLPKEIRSCNEIEAFQRNLKTHLLVTFVNESTLANWFEETYKSILECYPHYFSEGN